MIRVAIVEDEAEIREQLMGYVQRYTRQYGTAFEVKTVADGLEILEDYRPVYDLILLDIEMKHLDGMETARRIRELDPEVMLVFITNMAQYAIKGYAVGALDYVLKPVPYFAFSQQLQKVEAQLRRSDDEYSQIQGPGISHRVPLRFGARLFPAGFRYAGAGAPGTGPWPSVHRPEAEDPLSHHGPAGAGRKAGRPALCPLQQRVSGQSGPGAGCAAEHGGGGAL